MKKFIILSIGIIIIILVVIFFTQRSTNSSGLKYETVEISKGDIKNTVWGTGSLEPVGYVDVSTEVSGTISKVFVDFNDKVKKGQILAIIDTTSLSLSVIKARSNYKKLKATYELTKLDYENNKNLYEKHLLSEYEMKKIESELDKALASLTSAKVELNQAETNLNHAIISSPTNGTIINKVVESGQTVAANFNSPTLFTIAKNLSDMEIHVYVDESDIGLVKEGQEVEFTVPPYPEKTFFGITEEIRIQPTIISNVVKYTAVVKTSNKEGLLLPGLTADVEFIIEEKNDVLLVPNKALNIVPTKKIMELVRNNMTRNKLSTFNSKHETSSKYTSGQSSSSGNQNKVIPEDIARVIYLDNKDNLKFGIITKGASDGQNTEIEKSYALKEGTKVITEFKSESVNSPKNTDENRRHGPPGLF